jgi:hypothetical protein
VIDDRYAATLRFRRVLQGRVEERYEAGEHEFPLLPGSVSLLNRTRLFFYGPFSLAVFLGQQLTSVGEVQLFEYQDPGYVPRH